MRNTIPTASRLLVAVRDQRRCVRCGSANRPQWHHRRTRSVHDDHTHESCNGISLCSTCHAWVHAYPRRAGESGYLLSRHTPFPGEHPILHVRWGWVLLTCDGLMTLTEKGPA